MSHKLPKRLPCLIHGYVNFLYHRTSHIYTPFIYQIRLTGERRPIDGNNSFFKSILIDLRAHTLGDQHRLQRQIHFIITFTVFMAAHTCSNCAVFSATLQRQMWDISLLNLLLPLLCVIVGNNRIIHQVSVYCTVWSFTHIKYNE